MPCPFIDMFYLYLLRLVPIVYVTVKHLTHTRYVLLIFFSIRSRHQLRVYLLQGARVKCRLHRRLNSLRWAQLHRRRIV